MPFADDFAACLSAAGINIPASSVPDQDALQSGVQKVQDWLASLDEDTSSAVDEITADFAVKAGVADPSVNIAPELAALLQAADALPAGLALSAFLQSCSDCSSNVGGDGR